MMFMMWISAACFMIVLSLVSAQNCDGPAGLKCLTDAAWWANNDNVLNLTESNLPQACTEGSNIKTCVDSSGCSTVYPKFGAEIVGIKNAMSYLCQDDNKKVYLDKVTCFNSAETKADIQKCLIDNGYTRIDRTTENGNSIFNCTNAKAGIKCYKSKLEKCEDDAQNLMTNFITKWFEESAKTASCYLSTSGATRNALGLTMLISVLALFLSAHFF